MQFIVVSLHVFVCIALIMIVLLQTGKGADMGASLGGAGNQTLFGTSGASTLLSKVTTVIAVLFMVTSLYLAYKSGHKPSTSVMEKAVEQPVSSPETKTTAPAGENTNDVKETSAEQTKTEDTPSQ
jgi:preprotein translocase subunit SecG